MIGDWGIRIPDIFRPPPPDNERLRTRRLRLVRQSLQERRVGDNPPILWTRIVRISRIGFERHPGDSVRLVEEPLSWSEAKERRVFLAGCAGSWIASESRGGTADCADGR